MILVAFLVFLYLVIRVFFLSAISFAALLNVIVPTEEAKTNPNFLTFVLSSVLLFHGLMKLDAPEWLFYVITAFRSLLVYRTWSVMTTEVIMPRAVLASLGPLWLLLWVEWEGFRVLFRY